MTYRVNVIEKMIGKVCIDIECSEDNRELIFYFNDGTGIKFYHQQDCCESVYIESIIGGRLAKLIGQPITLAEEFISSINDYESYTYTLYNFGVEYEHVQVRWVGSSNGYYSESVDHEWFMHDKHLPKYVTYTQICDKYGVH